MRNATSTEPSADSSADLQLVRQGCVELGRQAEGIAELVLPLLRQATQELARLEAQRDELRRAGVREAQQSVLPKLLERIDEQAQSVKRLERASRGLRELMTAVGGVGEQFQSALARRDVEQLEQQAITREEKRMWLQELNSLREQVRGQGNPSAASPAQQEELQRLRAESEAMPKLRAERDRLAHRVAELEKNLTTREQTLTAKEQTIEDLRRMIVLLTGDAASASAPSSPTSPKPVPAPASVVNLAPKAPPPPAMAPVPPRAKPADTRPADTKPADTLFGNSTMQLAHSMLETLGEEIVASPLTPPPVASQPLVPEHRVPSMEIMLEPLDELEPARPSLPPPVPMVPPVPALSPTAAKAALMPKASARVTPSGPALTPAPLPGMALRHAPAPPRPGTLVISEDMFDEMLVEQDSGKK